MQPTKQASNIKFSSVSRTGMNVTWERGNGAKCALLIRQGYKIPNELLTDGIGIVNTSGVFGDTGNTVINDTTVIYVGDGSSVSITGLSKYKLYYFKLVEFNDDGGFPEYLEEESNGSTASRWTLR